MEGRKEGRKERGREEGERAADRQLVPQVLSSRDSSPQELGPLHPVTCTVLISQETNILSQRRKQQKLDEMMPIGDLLCLQDTQFGPTNQSQHLMKGKKQHITHQRGAHTTLTVPGQLLELL